MKDKGKQKKMHVIVSQYNFSYCDLLPYPSSFYVNDATSSGNVGVCVYVCVCLAALDSQQQQHLHVGLKNTRSLWSVVDDRLILCQCEKYGLKVINI